MRGGATDRFNSRLGVFKTDLILELGSPTRQVQSAEQRDKKLSKPFLRIFTGPAAAARVDAATWPGFLDRQFSLV